MANPISAEGGVGNGRGISRVGRPQGRKAAMKGRGAKYPTSKVSSGTSGKALRVTGKQK